jgi:hypothetical protein
MGNYLRSVADRMAGVSRLRPRVPSLFEPYRPSEGLLAAGSAATGSVWGVALRRRSAPLDSEATVDAAATVEAARGEATVEAVRTVPDALHNTAPTPRDVARATPAPAHAPSEVGDGLLRPPLAASQSQTVAAPASDTSAASNSVATAADGAARTGRPATVASGGSGLREVPPRATAALGPAAIARRSEFEPQTVAAPPRPPERPTPRDDALGGARETAAGAVSDDTGSRARAAPPVHLQGAAPVTEMAAPTVNVVIGKITVQANVPSTPAPVPARAVAPAGPRLSLEQYLMQRGGRG